jgi:N-acyl-D-amino-acid deacylase
MARCGMIVVAWMAMFATAHGADRAETLRAAVERGLRVVEKAATSYPSHRECFSCHHQTLPLLAWTEAQRVHCDVTETVLPVQLAFTQKSFGKQRERLLVGPAIGGRAATASYGLWTLSLADTPADETSDAIVHYLLSAQHENGSWRPPSNRPPLEESAISCTVLSAAGLQRFARDDRQPLAEVAIARARDWLSAAPRKTQEDVVFALWATTVLHTTQPSPAVLLDELQQSQREDGGWGAVSNLPSDAYATGQTLYVLLETPSPITAELRDRAVDALLSTQQPDGSWHVVTRSKPIQEWFDNGDPHGDDQFISIAATSWATAALARHLRELRPAPSR